jgi:hypothetical protein
MHRLIVLAVGLCVMAVAAPVRGQTYWEVEHARMNALAGGPTNAYDADLLKRYGCYSGTRSAFCQGLVHQRRYHRARRRVQ